MTEDLIPIGRFARAAQLSHKALRLYDDNGLLAPKHVDDATGYRFYAWQQLRTARRIALLREAGLPLEEIRRFLADPRPEHLDDYAGELEGELAERLSILEFVRATTEKEPMYDVSFRRAEEERYVSRTRNHVPQNELEAFVISTLEALVRKHEPAGDPFTVYHGLAPQNAEDEVEIGPIEVCLPTSDGDRVLPAVEVGFTVARGDRCRYPQIVVAYDAVWEWARERRRELSGPPREIYRFIPGEERVFEIAWPLV